MDIDFVSEKDLKMKNTVLYRLALSEWRFLVYSFLKNRADFKIQIEVCLFNYKKQLNFIDYYKIFIQNSTILKISANIESYCKALINAKNAVCACKNAIVLIRMLDPFFNSFFYSFNNMFFLKAVTWRVIKFLFFIKNGIFANFSILFIKRHFEKLFE